MRQKNAHWMVYSISTLILSTLPITGFALDYFKDEQGHTNWQYVANWSSGILIILLSFTVLRLYHTRRALHRANHSLTQSNSVLEERVAERTATLDDSNQLLQKTNHLLEGEIHRHKETTKHLHASQAYVESILTSMPLMLVGLDAQGTVTQWNTGAEKITGLSSQQILDKSLWETYPIIPVNKDEVLRALEANETIHLHRSQRGQRHFDIVIYPIQNAMDTGVVLLIDDVTKHTQSMNQLIQRDKLSAMGELASSMAQDINMPLQHILQNIELTAAQLATSAPQPNPDAPSETTLNTERPLQEWQALAESLQIPLNAARAESYRAAAITSNLVDFASSHQQIAKPHDVVEILEHAVSLSENIYANMHGLKFSDIHIARHYEENLPPAPCNSSELQQVFLSLLRHCCYALAEKSQAPVTEQVALTTSDAELEQAANSVDTETAPARWSPKITLTVLESYEVLWIKIQHNGLGLSPDEQQMIFEPFFSNTLEQNGVKDTSGLGADRRQSFSHFIVTEHHKGQMAVTSDIDVGTTFHMELRLK